jgi:hypothetical protein
MDLARAPCRAPLTARKMGSGYENVSSRDRPRPGLSRVSPRPHMKALGTRLRIRQMVVVTRSLVGCRTFLYFSIPGLHFVRFQIFGYTAESFQDIRQDIRFTKQISVTRTSNFLNSKFYFSSNVLLIF